MEQEVIGLDVGKAWLDGYLPASGRRLRVGNHAQGVAELVGALGDRQACLVVMEASGGYERIAHGALVAQGVLAAIVNPSSAERSIRLRSSRRPRAPEDGCATSPRPAACWPRPTGSMPG